MSDELIANIEAFLRSGDRVGPADRCTACNAPLRGGAHVALHVITDDGAIRDACARLCSFQCVRDLTGGA